MKEWGKRYKKKVCPVSILSLDVVQKMRTYVKIWVRLSGNPPALTLILLTWRVWWAPNITSRWQMKFNSAFKGLITNVRTLSLYCFFDVLLWMELKSGVSVLEGKRWDYIRGRPYYRVSDNLMDSVCN